MISKKFLDSSRQVQERWWRIVFQKRFGKKLKVLLLWRLHRKLNKEFQLKDKVINNAILTVVEQMEKINVEYFPASEQFFNLSLYFLLAERDIQALKADAFAHPNQTKRGIALRTLLLTIYEWDMTKVTGKKMGFIFDSTALSDESKKEVSGALKELRKAHKVTVQQFREVRLNTIAHRDADALNQYEIISKLDIRDFSGPITNFYQASDNLLKALVMATIEIGSQRSLFNQILHPKKRA
ncbi:hypothetical protein F0250_22100 [Vibrio cyclitrophicus]|uniref:hypothetical protein n=1 Tax=Vibrio cyclitrophicus TaxID=47951 RepID=UPI00148BEF7A|nr:hypothetical protein [Vibrio cyclitrophicus]NOI36585.1 hypothetical protein [Vibrio cyclitrophicus]